jgi:TorA maturation chaperone TorD
MKPHNLLQDDSLGAALDLARQTLYQFFAIASGDPLSPRWRTLGTPLFCEAVAAAAEFLSAEAAATEGFRLAPGELPAERLALEVSSGALDLLARASSQKTLGDYERIFGLIISKECPPYETEYCPQTFSVYRSHQLADVAGFYHAFGLAPSSETPERHDHLSLELEFMAWLIAKERLARAQEDETAAENANLCRDAQSRFAKEHLAWWLPAFARALWRKAEGLERESFDDFEIQPATFHGALARALAAFIAAERALLDLPAPSELAIPNPTEVEPAEEAGCADCSLAQLAPGALAPS